jgi:hypothetical protein
MSARLVPLVLGASIVANATASAQVAVPLTVGGNKARAAIELPGGFGVELSIEFEQVVGLTPTALSVSASLVSPLNQLLLTRLPAGSTVPLGLPVLLTIEAAPGSALSFSGLVRIGLYTHNLTLNPVAPLGLFSSSNGGPFREITSQVAMGSYRVNGSGPGFSEFLIARDPRPIDTVVAGKFDRLDRDLTDHAGAMPATIQNELRQILTEARTLYAAGLTVPAMEGVAAFAESVRARSGADIPDVWRAHDDRVNVAGLLRAGAETLRFSLLLKANAQ